MGHAQQRIVERVGVNYHLGKLAKKCRLRLGKFERLTEVPGREIWVVQQQRSCSPIMDSIRVVYARDTDKVITVLPLEDRVVKKFERRKQTAKRFYRELETEDTDNDFA
jgi:hypothetical protein